ncbi:hypothetical protein, partial [Lentilitoribacter sp. EG35]|uniref:hypothetical protein n=1 Tax=Lentilitoribacter sp. EG35 TaxID=3234192 RepID=UPI003460DBC1
KRHKPRSKRANTLTILLAIQNRARQSKSTQTLYQQYRPEAVIIISISPMLALNLHYSANY